MVQPGTKPEPRRLCVTLAAAAELLSIGKRSVELMVARGELRSVKIGRSRRIRMSDLQEHLDKRAEDDE